MNRGDVWQLDLGTAAGRRPALILTRQGVIAHVNKITVAEITSRGKGYPTEVALGQKANLPRESYVQLDNIQTIAKGRFLKKIVVSTTMGPGIQIDPNRTRRVADDSDSPEA